MKTAFQQYTDLMMFNSHLKSRGLFDANPHVWVDWTGKLVTFPLWSTSGVLVGYQKYDWLAPKLRSNQGRYFTWIGESHKPFGIWGMEYVLSSDRFTTPLLVTEGVWDAIRAIGAGYRACAILTATPHKSLVKWFKLVTLGQHTVSIRDNDGDNKCGMGLDKLTDVGYTVQGTKDLGEMDLVRAKSWLKKTVEN